MYCYPIVLFKINVSQKAQRNGLAVEPQEDAKVLDDQELPEVKTDKVIMICILSFTLTFRFKGIVRPKMKILSFIHSDVPDGFRQRRIRKSQSLLQKRKNLLYLLMAKNLMKVYFDKYESHTL